MEAEGWEWEARTCPVDVGSRGFVVMSTINLPKEVGIGGLAQQKIVKDLATTATERN